MAPSCRRRVSRCEARGMTPWRPIWLCEARGCPARRPRSPRRMRPALQCGARSSWRRAYCLIRSWESPGPTARPPPPSCWHTFCVRRGGMQWHAATRARHSLASWGRWTPPHGSWWSARHFNWRTCPPSAPGQPCCSMSPPTIWTGMTMWRHTRLLSAICLHISSRAIWQSCRRARYHQVRRPPGVL